MASTDSTRRRRGERDRDDQGRAQNSRPRDGLGRPLPYGTPGVTRQPEGVQRTPDETAADAQRLLDDGMPFHAHEVFEDQWKSTEVESERELWKGLAQLAVGLTHAARGNVVGGARLLRRGAGYLEPYADRPPHDIDVVGLRTWAESEAGRLDDGGSVDDPAAHAPRLR